MPIGRIRPTLITRAMARKRLVCLAEPKAAGKVRRKKLTAAKRRERTDLVRVLGKRVMKRTGKGLLLRTKRKPSQTLDLDFEFELQPLEIRLRFIYAVDDSGKVGGAAPPTEATLRPMFTALVEGMRQDWAGTGIDFVFLPDCDFEVRKDSQLNNDFTLPAEELAKFPAAASDFTQAQIDGFVNAGSNDDHRNKVAAERPNSILLIVGEPNALGLNEAGTEWVYTPHVSGQWSGGQVDFVVLNKNDFTVSAAQNKKDASRAAHEIGHFLWLWHTHRESPALHAEPTGPGIAVGTQARLDRWKKAIADWLDANLPAGSSANAARELYDQDRDGGVDDTPADPGPGIFALANLAAGVAEDPLGPIGMLEVAPANTSGVVTFVPDRNNVMSYFLDGAGTEPMTFSPQQIDVMRDKLINGNRRRLVAAQLGDTVEPQTRICAVWSPNPKGQFFGSRADLDQHEGRHNEWTGKNFHLASQCAYADGDLVLYDGVWNEGARPQQTMWGWAADDLFSEVPARANDGWRVAHIQAYRHPGADLRYNLILEQGSQPQEIKFDVDADQLDEAWESLMPAGHRLRHLDSTIDHLGRIRYAAIFEPGDQQQRFITGWALEDLAPEYGVEWEGGRRFATLAVVWTVDGPRYSAIWNPEEDGQVVMWLHNRERILEVYNEMWCQGFKLRSLHTVIV